MQIVIAITPVNPMRAEPTHRSEMVSQILFGEMAEVMDHTTDFIKIRSLNDRYEGWVQSVQLVEVPAKLNEDLLLGFSLENKTIEFNGMPMLISLGTPVWHIKMMANYSLNYGNINYKKELAFIEENIKKVTLPYLNTAYLWGGRSAFGVDCSGFTQQVFQYFNIKLPRDAHQQALLGKSIGFLEECNCGDLAFFDNPDGKITHVGIIMNNETIIHSSGKVRIDKIDTQGIVNVDSGLRTHQLRIIKRMP